MTSAVPSENELIQADKLSKLKRMLANFFGWAFAVNGGVLFLSLFLLFALGTFSLSWARAFFQLTERVHVEQIGYVAAILAGLFFAVRWEIRQPEKFAQRQYWLQTVMRYVLAYIFLDYGFAKIFKGQFTTNLSTLDVPLGEISGFELAWRFFGYSYLYALFIAASQLLGGLLLVGVSLRLLQVKPVPVADLLPALVVAPLLTALVVALRP